MANNSNAVAVLDQEIDVDKNVNWTEALVNCFNGD
jgi:hypothetical protein